MIADFGDVASAKSMNTLIHHDYHGLWYQHVIESVEGVLKIIVI